MSTTLAHLELQRELHTKHLKEQGRRIIRDIEAAILALDTELPTLNTAGVIQSLNGFGERYALICAAADTIWRLKHEEPGA